jgi:N-acetyl-anhydromuramyl-L-alanine amidase AmpD
VALYPEAVWIESHASNYRLGRDQAVRELVIHTTEGENVEALHNWLTAETEPRLSVHFAVDQDGRVFQYVDTDNTAYHARSHNAFSVGIEHVGFANDPSTWTPAMIESSARLAAWINENHPEILLDEEHVVAHGSFQDDRTDPGPHFPWTEYLARARGYRGGAAVASVFGSGTSSVVVVVIAALAIALLWGRP